MEPASFVAELRARWELENPARQPDDPTPPATDPPTIFISYMHEDAEAAERLYHAITELGGDVWMDKHTLGAGDRWNDEVLSAIRHSVRLFLPIISANTEREPEGFVFQEWEEAADRLRRIPRQRFIVPVIVDADYNGDPCRFRQVPTEFKRCHFGRAPGGRLDDDLRKTLITEIRAMRRIDAA